MRTLHFIYFDIPTWAALKEFSVYASQQGGCWFKSYVGQGLSVCHWAVISALHKGIRHQNCRVEDTFITLLCRSSQLQKTSTMLHKLDMVCVPQAANSFSRKHVKSETEAMFTQQRFWKRSMSRWRHENNQKGCCMHACLHKDWHQSVFKTLQSGPWFL